MSYYLHDVVLLVICYLLFYVFFPVFWLIVCGPLASVCMWLFFVVHAVIRYVGL